MEKKIKVILQKMTKILGFCSGSILLLKVMTLTYIQTEKLPTKDSRKASMIFASLT